MIEFPIFKTVGTRCIDMLAPDAIICRRPMRRAPTYYQLNILVFLFQIT
jgi:hypothetical protein